MTQDSALDPASPRVLQPVVAHFTDVIVDRAPPVQRRRPAAPAAVAIESPRPEPIPLVMSVDTSPPAPEMPSSLPPSDDWLAATDESWFASGTLAPPERATQPDVAEDDGISDRQLVIAAVVTIGSTVSLGVSLGALFASMG